MWEDSPARASVTPPTLAVTDAAVLSASADAAILVVRAGETEEAAAQRALCSEPPH